MYVARVHVEPFTKEGGSHCIASTKIESLLGWPPSGLCARTWLKVAGGHAGVSEKAEKVHFRHSKLQHARVSGLHVHRFRTATSQSQQPVRKYELGVLGGRGLHAF